MGKGISRRAGLAVAAAALAAGGLAALVGAAGAGAATSSGTVIAAAPGPFGPMLVVGSGKLAGYTAYFLTSDTTTTSTCTAKVYKLPFGTIACTGAPGNRTAEWPAITTTGTPVAGPGVSASMLGTVTKPGVGMQVTYAGHPLYLFDSGPGQITGEGWDEPTLPPWHGVWYAMTPTGAAVAWPQMLTTVTIGHQRVLAAFMLTGAGWEPFPVYSFNSDGAHASACAGACAVAWPPVLTSGRPGVDGSLSVGKLGAIRRPDGDRQVTYGGHELYLFAFEKIALTSTGFAATGSGNGVHAFNGVFKLVTP